MFKSMEEFDHHSIDEFLSITEAVDYAEKHYNVKRTMLHKYLVYRNVRIERCND